jgi:putative nucleotidyltransferase with HDIG domain
LKIGDYIKKIEASWITNPFFKNEFEVKTSEEIKKLKEHKIKYVHILPRKEKPKEIPDKEKIKNINVSEYYLELDKLDNSFDLYAKTVKILKNVMNDVRTGKLLNKDAISSISKKMLEITKYNKNLLSSVAKLKSYDEYTFEHSINVGIFASSLAKHIGLPEQEVEILTLSGILHDTGKMLVPSEILNKPGKLTDEEFKIMKSHVIKGYDYLLKQGFDKEPLKIVIEHHERYDGSGYPYGLSDKDISLHGKIGAVVDIYDAITSDRVYHKGMQAAKALKLMFNWSDSHIDKKVFEFFVTHIGIYPVGTLLMLNTNELALVGKYENNSLNPIVVIFINPKGKFITPFLVDLSKKSVVQRKVIGPVNPETVEIPEQATKMVEEMNSSLS